MSTSLESNRTPSVQRQPRSSKATSPGSIEPCSSITPTEATTPANPSAAPVACFVPGPTAHKHSASVPMGIPNTSSPHLTRRFKPLMRENACDIQPMTPLKLAESSREEPESVSLVDIRPYTMYSFTHIETAISICIPSTLLKRQTFGFSRILEFVAPQDVEVLTNVSHVRHIVFYDQFTTQCSSESSLQRTAAKFLGADPELKKRLFFVVGGLVSVARDVPDLIEAGDDLLAAASSGSDTMNSEKSSDAKSPTTLASLIDTDMRNEEPPKLTLSSVKAAPKSPFSSLPVLTGLDPTLGSPLHTPSRSKPPLDESSRILVEGEIASRSVDFPNWLINAVKRTEGGQNVLAEVFQRSQAAELRRVSGLGPSPKETSSIHLSSPHIRSSISPRSPTTPFSDSSVVSGSSVSSTGTSPLNKKEYTHHQRNHVFQQQLLHHQKQQSQQQQQQDQHSNQHSRQTQNDSHSQYSSQSQPSTIPSGQSSPQQQYVIVAGDDPRKNRYTNIAPFGHNRVVVRGNEYLNASYIRSHLSVLQYIASQAPVPASFGDFWWCCWEQNVPLIVMLTTLRTESGQIKGHKYWFESEYNGLHIRTVSKSVKGVGNSATGVIIRRIELSLNGETREIHHSQYENWPDLGCPADPNEVLESIEIKRQLLPASRKNANVLVHCSAGCGRTGTFCTIDSVTDYLREVNYQQARRDDKDRVHEVVSEFRKQRMAMVQNQRQSSLCYQAVMLWYLKRLENTCTIAQCS